MGSRTSSVERKKMSKKTWEYTAIAVPPGENTLAVLNGIGEEGWEAWAMVPEKNMILLKREKSKIEIAKNLGGLKV